MVLDQRLHLRRLSSPASGGAAQDSAPHAVVCMSIDSPAAVSFSQDLHAGYVTQLPLPIDTMHLA